MIHLVIEIMFIEEKNKGGLWSVKRRR